jgi:hypothetical protein
MSNLEEPTTWLGDPRSTLAGVTGGAVGEGGTGGVGAGDKAETGILFSADGEDKHPVQRIRERIKQRIKPIKTPGLKVIIPFSLCTSENGTIIP